MYLLFIKMCDFLVYTIEKGHFDSSWYLIFIGALQVFLTKSLSAVSE